jgi:hypothetical protein
MAKDKNDPTMALILGSIGFILGVGAVFVFGSKKGEKYRKQAGEFSADMLDAISEGCREIKKSVLR